MRLISLFLLFTVFYNMSYCQTRSLHLADSLFATIDLQKGFNDDLVTININGTLIFRNLVVSTHPLTDFTGVSLGISSNKDVLVVSFNDQKSQIEISGNKLVVEIDVNDKRNTFRIDLSKGKYIGFTKAAGNRLAMRQLTRRFFYD